MRHAAIETNRIELKWRELIRHHNNSQCNRNNITDSISIGFYQSTVFSNTIRLCLFHTDWTRYSQSNVIHNHFFIQFFFCRTRWLELSIFFWMIWIYKREKFCLPMKHVLCRKKNIQVVSLNPSLISKPLQISAGIFTMMTEEIGGEAVECQRFSLNYTKTLWAAICGRKVFEPNGKILNEMNK